MKEGQSGYEPKGLPEALEFMQDMIEGLKKRHPEFGQFTTEIRGGQIIIKPDQSISKLAVGTFLQHIQLCLMDQKRSPNVWLSMAHEGKDIVIK